MKTTTATTTTASSARLDEARSRFDAATRAARTARIDAAEDLRNRAIRRTTGLRWSLGVIALLGVVGIVAAVILGFGNRSASAREDAGLAATAAARTAIATMLTANPDAPEDYADRVIAVSTGEQRKRLTDSRDALVTAISGLSADSRGLVADAALLSDPRDGDESGSRAEVLVVADATNPELLGGSSGDAPADDVPAAGATGAAPADTGTIGTRRLTLEVTMEATDQGWRVAQVSPV